jgi:hypothetical protein
VAAVLTLARSTCVKVRSPIARGGISATVIGSLCMFPDIVETEAG